MYKLIYISINKCRDHSILIEIKIKDRCICVWDSMRKELAMYQDMIDMIQRYVMSFFKFRCMLFYFTMLYLIND